MLKKLLLILAALAATTSLALAAVDVNKATQAELESVKGIGPGIAGRILDERRKGPFKDWSDFEGRVKGVGEKNAARYSEAGLTVNGQPLANAPARPEGDGSKAAGTKSDRKPFATKKPDAKGGGSKE